MSKLRLLAALALLLLAFGSRIPAPPATASGPVSGPSVRGIDERDRIPERLASLLERARNHDCCREAASYHLLRSPPLRVPSGRVVAADGIMLLQDHTPFRQTVPADRPLRAELVAARFPLVGGADERAVFAVLRFADQPVGSWRAAKVETGPAGENVCYPVDSGMGGFFDANAFAEFARYFYRPGAALELAETAQPFPMGFALHGASGDGAIFPAGFGDGCYSTYELLTPSGEVLGLATDFMGVLSPARP